MDMVAEEVVSSGSAVGNVPPAEVSEKQIQTQAESEQNIPFMLLALLSAVSMIEGVDDAVLPAVAKTLAEDMSIDFKDVTDTFLIQGLAMAVAAPVWGILADRQILSRKALMTCGAVSQGAITVLLAFINGYTSMLVLRAINGAMLASLRPIAVSVISDTTSENNRGKAFAWLQCAAMIGLMVGALIGTPLAPETVMGMQGWRAVFIFVGGIGILVGAVVGLLMTEPEHEVALSKANRSALGAMLEEAGKLLSYFTLPSFLVLILQGCIGLVPWKVLPYTTVYFQVAGLGNVAPAVLAAVSQLAAAAGNLIGGKVGDYLGRRCPNHGRAFTAQISVSAGIPIAAMLFLVTPPEASSGFNSSAFVWYFFLTVVMGLSATWCAVGVNWPILSQIVMPENRGAVMAWEAAVEGAFAAVVGNWLVGFFAQTVFGFDLKKADDSDNFDSENLMALGKALTLTSAVPWLICLVFYSLLHWALPRDLTRIAKLKAARESAGKMTGKDRQASATSFSTGAPTSGNTTREFEGGGSGDASEEIEGVQTGGDVVGRPQNCST